MITPYIGRLDAQATLAHCANHNKRHLPNIIVQNKGVNFNLEYNFHSL